MKYAKNKSVNLLIHDNDYQIIRGSTNWSIRSKELNVHEIPNLKMIGDYQYNYAAASLIALNEILPDCLNDHNNVKRALSETEIYGRFQYLSKSPDIILDVAHNEDAARSLSENIKRLRYNNIQVVLGILADKDVYSIVEPFSNLVDRWHIGTINSERGMNADEIKYRVNSIYKNKLSIETYASVTSAFNQAKLNQQRDSLLLVYGSFYTVSEVLRSHISQRNKNNAI